MMKEKNQSTYEYEFLFKVILKLKEKCAFILRDSEGNLIANFKYEK